MRRRIGSLRKKRCFRFACIFATSDLLHFYFLLKIRVFDKPWSLLALITWPKNSIPYYSGYELHGIFLLEYSKLDMKHEINQRVTGKTTHSERTPFQL